MRCNASGTFFDSSQVVIDTLQRIRTVNNDVSSYANDYRDIGMLKGLADRHRIAVLLVHHLRKLKETRAASQWESEKLLKEFQSQAGKISETYSSRLSSATEVQKLLDALTKEPRHYRLFYLLSPYTGFRRGEPCALQWSDIEWEQRSIHIRRNAVKVTDEEIFTKAPKAISGDRYVYFSLEMESLLRECRQECVHGRLRLMTEESWKMETSCSAARAAAFP